MRFFFSLPQDLQLSGGLLPSELRLLVCLSGGPLCLLHAARRGRHLPATGATVHMLRLLFFRAPCLLLVASHRSRVCPNTSLPICFFFFSSFLFSFVFFFFLSLPSFANRGPEADCRGLILIPSPEEWRQSSGEPTLAVRPSLTTRSRRSRHPGHRRTFCFPSPTFSLSFSLLSCSLSSLSISLFLSLRMFLWRSSAVVQNKMDSSFTNSSFTNSFIFCVVVVGLQAKSNRV
jgi:hypothetical protein